MHLVKQHADLQRFPNAAFITSGVQLDKILAVPVITLAAESLPAKAQQYLFR